MNNKEEVLKNYEYWYKNFDLEKHKKKFREKIKNIKPERLYVELTPICNLNCISCPRNYANLNYPDLSFENFKKILNNIVETIKIINFTGFGEASLHKEFQKFLQYSKEKNYITEHTSNASIFNIENLKFLDSILFSLDGIKKVKEIRKGIKDNAIENIKKSVEYKYKNNLSTNISINMVLAYYTIDEIENMFDFCEKTGIDHLNLAIFVNSPSLYETELFKQFEKIIQKNLKIINYKKIVDLYTNNNYSFSLTIKYPIKKLKGICIYPFRDFQINSKGELVMCCRTLVNPTIFGNLIENKMEEILNTKKFKYFQKAHLEDLPLDICDKCSAGYPIE
jgi:radical SAM protein with 4Fe4S-binding SPASM domain